MQVREFGVEGEIRMNKLTSKSDFATFLLYSILLTSFPFQNKVPSPCDAKKTFRENLKMTMAFSPVSSLITSPYSPSALAVPRKYHILFELEICACCFLYLKLLTLSSSTGSPLLTFQDSDEMLPSPRKISLTLLIPYLVRYPLLCFQRKLKWCTNFSVTPEYYTRLFIPASLAYLEKRSVLFGTWYLMLIAWGVNQWVS